MVGINELLVGHGAGEVHSVYKTHHANYTSSNWRPNYVVAQDVLDTDFDDASLGSSRSPRNDSTSSKKLTARRAHHARFFGIRRCQSANLSPELIVALNFAPKDSHSCSDRSINPTLLEDNLYGVPRLRPNAGLPSPTGHHQRGIQLSVEGSL
jgi:hypothetical protein